MAKPTQQSKTTPRSCVLVWCSELAGAELTHPFGDDTAVFKVGGKMFAVLPLVGEPGSVNLKVEPELGRSLVHDYPAITPGYHMNKRHWVTVQLDGTIPEKALRNLIEDSHDLVVAGLPAKVRAALIASS
ncbi:MAG: MmcQ/YjbR family DNA-binding protein [Acidimicrobiales bacterium]